MKSRPNMRLASLILLFTVASVLQAQDLASFSPSWTIRELAKSEKVPVKKLAEALGHGDDDVDRASLSALGITREQAAKSVAEYRDGESMFVGSIVLTGMVIVFVSLIVVAFLIGLLRHLHVFERRAERRSGMRRSVASVVGTITSTGDLSDYSIAAVVTAIFLHEEEVDSENRLLLTWRRTTGQRWKTGSAMPNESYFSARRGRS